ncbi:hypothetical protein FD754_022107, partial [Muntiacus muntjak]
LEPSGPLGKMSLPIGMYRRAFSYDDALEDPTPMTPPPSDMGSIPWKPVIPERKYQHLAKVEEGEPGVSPRAPAPPAASDSEKAPVVKAKATHVIMSSLITTLFPLCISMASGKLSQLWRPFPLHEAGVWPAVGGRIRQHSAWWPGAAAAAAAAKLKLQSGETAREERQPASTQSTPSSSPQASPKQKTRGWFTSGSSTALPGPSLSTMDSGSGDKDRSSTDKWSLFGPRSLQKSESGGFAIQAYRGAQKPSPMEVMRAQAARRAEEPAASKPPKMDVPATEGTRQLPRAHSLKPRDMNVLTPTGF